MQEFSCEYCEIFENTYFEEQMQTLLLLVTRCSFLCCHRTKCLVPINSFVYLRKKGKVRISLT